MKKFLRVFFAILTAIASVFGGQPCKTAEPVFPQTEPKEKIVIETEDFSMGDYDLVVAQNGSDTAEGTLASPLATVQEAKRRLAALPDRETPVHVWIRGGSYTLDEALSFTANDRGNVVYSAYPGEAVAFTGGKTIKGGWQTVSVNGVTAWKRPVDKTFTALYGKTFGTVRRTRYPESGYFKIREQCFEDALFTVENTPWSYMLGECAFFGDMSDLAGLEKFRNPTDMLVRVLHYWKDELLPVKAYDPQTGKVSSTKYCSMMAKAGDRYFFENVFEALNEPGEWYLDKSEMQLYYVPLAGETQAEVELYTASTEYLLQIDGCSGISFRGITFRDTGWHPMQPEELHDFYPGVEHPQAAFSTFAAMNIRNADTISFDACTFLNIGFTGIRFHENVQDSSITRCLFENIGGNAVYVSGVNADNARTTANILVQDNHICGYGRNWANAIGVLVTHAKNCDISHNEIHDGYYTAISVGWNWGYAPHVTDGNRICDNLIYDIGQGWLSDMGGIYTLGMQPNTVISGNRIYNVAADEGEGGYGGWGIYLDEGSSGILVEKNLVYDCGSQGFHQHYGKENLVRNNIFALNRKGQLRNSRTEEHIATIFERNIVVGDNSAMFCRVIEDTRKWEEKGNFFWDYTRSAFVYSTGREDDDGRTGDRYSRTAMRRLGHYTDAQFADPMFRDALHFDFTLADNSPAVKAGFERWDYSAAGTVSLIEIV